MTADIDFREHLVVAAAAPDLIERASEIAGGLNLALWDQCVPSTTKQRYLRECCPAPVMLRVDHDGLSLLRTDNSGVATLRIEFGSGSLGYRLRRVGSARELLVKATGLRSGRGGVLLDATAGLGRDAFVLAMAGWHVVMLEQHPLLVVLLQDALARARLRPELAAVCLRIELHAAEATEWMKGEGAVRQPDVVYLDPMFGSDAGRAAVKKELQVLRALLPDDPADPVALLTAARAIAGRRVVVKRPLRAAPLGALRPSTTYAGRSVRFDVYVTGGTSG